MRTWCEECEFWKGEDFNAEGRPQSGECHKKAPAALVVTEGPTAWAYWPTTLPHNFCGEGQRREKAA